MSILALNTISGKTATISEREFNHPVLGKNLVRVDEAKDYIPELYQPKTVEEFTEGKRSRSKKTEAPEEVAELETGDE